VLRRRPSSIGERATARASRENTTSMRMPGVCATASANFSVMVLVPIVAI
jgi:hypothetical protein